MDEQAEAWSAIADGWAELWGGLTAPVWEPLRSASGVAAGDRVLDVGCGTGELLAHLHGLGLHVAGADVAPAMVERARARAAGADVRVARAEALPWLDETFDLVTAVNVLHIVDDPDVALAELVRVCAVGGHVAVASWAEAELNDLDAVQVAVSRALDEETHDVEAVEAVDGLETLLSDAGLVVSHGLAEAVWGVPDADVLVRGITLGMNADTAAELAPVVVEAARPFRDGSGYRLVNHLRYAVGCRIATSR
jgi:SAM-dependent methyltransferase